MAAISGSRAELETIIGWSENRAAFCLPDRQAQASHSPARHVEKFNSSTGPDFSL
jgi:hypothetical protein